MPQNAKVGTQTHGTIHVAIEYIRLILWLLAKTSPDVFLHFFCDFS